MKCKDCESKGCHYRDTFNDGTCVYNHEKLTTFDWQLFRAEAAKEFVSIICNHKYYTQRERYPVICKEAIALADELIKQLKELEHLI